MTDCGKQQAIDDDTVGRKSYTLQCVRIACCESFNNVRPIHEKKAKYANI